MTEEGTASHPFPEAPCRNVPSSLGVGGNGTISAPSPRRGSWIQRFFAMLPPMSSVYLAVGCVGRTRTRSSYRTSAHGHRYCLFAGEPRAAGILEWFPLG